MDKLRRAQDLLSHRIPDGDMVEVLDRALSLLVEQVQKEGHAVLKNGGKVAAARSSMLRAADSVPRRIPTAGAGRDTEPSSALIEQSASAGFKPREVVADAAYGMLAYDALWRSTATVRLARGSVAASGCASTKP